MSDSKVKLNLNWRKRSVMNPTYKVIAWLYNWTSLYRLFKNRFDPDDKSFLVEEFYNIGFGLVILGILLFGPWLYNGHSWPAWVFCIPPIYRLYELLVGHLKIILLESERFCFGQRYQDGILPVRHAQRWTVFVLFDFLQIVFCFAIVYSMIDIFGCYSELPFNQHFYQETKPIEFMESIETGINAFYFSLVTIVTLGYGDFSPTKPIYRLLVSGQILYGLFFLVVVFIVVIPTIKTRIDPDIKYKNH